MASSWAWKLAQEPWPFKGPCLGWLLIPLHSERDATSCRGSSMGTRDELGIASRSRLTSRCRGLTLRHANAQATSAAHAPACRSAATSACAPTRSCMSASLTGPHCAASAWMRCSRCATTCSPAARRPRSRGGTTAAAPRRRLPSSVPSQKSRAGGPHKHGKPCRAVQQRLACSAQPLALHLTSRPATEGAVFRTPFLR